MRVKETRIFRRTTKNRLFSEKNTHKTSIAYVKSRNRVTYKKGGAKITANPATRRKEKQMAAMSEQEKTAFKRIEKIKEDKKIEQLKEPSKFVKEGPLDYFEEVCLNNNIPKGEIDDLIKDKHALDNQHDFTANRGDFTPSAKFIYFLNKMFNMSALDAKTDTKGNLPDVYPPLDEGSPVPTEIFNRNKKLAERNIRFADLEWDTFKYFSRRLSERFSCTPDIGIAFEEIDINNLIKADGTLNADILTNILNKQHIVINTADLDPTKKFKGEKLNNALKSLNNIYINLLGLSEDDIYLNFDAKTKGIFSKPLSTNPNVNQLITYQNLYDSGNNMFSILSDDTSTYPKTKLIDKENALNDITSNYFSKQLQGRGYTMKYELMNNLDSFDTKNAIDNIFNWAQIKVTQKGLTGDDITILKTSLIPKQKGGPGVGVLANYIDTYITTCSDENSQEKRKMCLHRLETQNGFDTVHISELLAKAKSTSDIFKLCVDIKGCGDAEQVNAAWYFNKKKSCIMITGDILCYMYSIIMGLPSVLIIGNKIYLSKGISKIPLSPQDLTYNKIKNHMAIFTGILKTISDITDGGNKLTTLVASMKKCIEYPTTFMFGEQIQTDLETKLPDINSIDKIKTTVSLLIKLKILDIINYLTTIYKILSPLIASTILPIIVEIIKEYGSSIDIFNILFSIQTNISASVDTRILESSLTKINEEIAKIKTDLQLFENILGNFKNKKYNGRTKTFFNGITELDFFKEDTTISSYTLFNYDRDHIYKIFAAPLYKIMFLEPTAEKNPRYYLGKEIRSSLQKFLDSFFTFKLIDFGIGSGFFTNDIVGGYDTTKKDTRDCNLYTTLLPYFVDDDISATKKENICDTINIILANTIEIVSKSYISSIGGVPGETVDIDKEIIGGSFNYNPEAVAIIQNSISNVLKTSRDILLTLKTGDSKIIISEPFISEEIKLTDIETENIALEELRECFKEIIQDAYFFSKSIFPDNTIQITSINDTYNNLYDKWINEVLNIEAIHNYNCKSYKNLIISLPTDNGIAINIKFFMLNIFASIHNNGLIQNKTFDEIYKMVEDEFSKFKQQHSIGQMKAGPGEVLEKYPLIKEAPIGFAYGGKSYGERSLTKMLKGLKLNKSKKPKQIKTIKNNKK